MKSECLAIDKKAFRDAVSICVVSYPTPADCKLHEGEDRAIFTHFSLKNAWQMIGMQ